MENGIFKIRHWLMVVNANPIVIRETNTKRFVSRPNERWIDRKLRRQSDIAKHMLHKCVRVLSGNMQKYLNRFFWYWIDIEGIHETCHIQTHTHTRTSDVRLHSEIVNCSWILKSREILRQILSEGKYSQCFSMYILTLKKLKRY